MAAQQAALGRRSASRVDPSPGAPGRAQRVLMVVLALATFGPYVVGSIRTEQIVVYGLLVLTLPFALPRLQTRGGLRLLVPWTLYVVVASLSLLPGPTPIAPYPAGSLLAGYDNVLLPIAIMLLIWSLVPAEHAQGALRTFSAAVAVCAGGNAVLAIVGIVVDLSPVLRPFWTPDGEDSVADLAAELGRLGGVFNQPVEAGLAYGIGGICAVYVWRERPVLLAALLAIITVGGLLSVSKAFILGALPFVLAYWLWSQRGHRRIVTVLAALLALLGVLQSGLVERWVGLDYLTRLLDPSGGLLDFYSAGRFAERSTFSIVVDAALAHSPLVGVGPGGLGRRVRRRGRRGARRRRRARSRPLCRDDGGGAHAHPHRRRGGEARTAARHRARRRMPRLLAAHRQSRRDDRLGAHRPARARARAPRRRRTDDDGRPRTRTADADAGVSNGA